MIFDMTEQNSFENIEQSETYEKKAVLHNDFITKKASADGIYSNFEKEIGSKIVNWINIEGSNIVNEIYESSFLGAIKDVYYGIEKNGSKTLGLDDISKRNFDRTNYSQIKQQAGFTGEVLSTTKDNIESKLLGKNTTTYRADDLKTLNPDLLDSSELAKTNDQYVDKVVVDNSTGNIIERIQVKFVGKDGADCLNKLLSDDFDKYFDDGKIDSLEIPKDYYDSIFNDHILDNKIADLESQLKHATEAGKKDAVSGINKRLEHAKKIKEGFLKRSNVEAEEAVSATKNPKAYINKIINKEILSTSNDVGVKSGLAAASLSAAVSTVDNIQKVIGGEITPLEAVEDITIDSAKSGAVGYCTGFVSSAVSSAMRNSSYKLLNSLGKTGVPAAVVSFGIESYECVSDYAQGNITGEELAYQLGENAADVAGGAIGSAIAGAVVGSVVPGAGNVVGFAAGLVGGMVGCAVASEAYETAISVGAEYAEPLLDKAKEAASEVIETAKDIMPDKFNDIRNSINSFANDNKLPFNF